MDQRVDRLVPHAPAAAAGEPVPAGEPAPAAEPAPAGEPAPAAEPAPAGEPAPAVSMSPVQPVSPVPSLPRLTRRRLLAAAAGAGFTAAAAPLLGAFSALLAPDASAAAGSTASHRWVLVFDLRDCDGCGHCTEACQANHYLDEQQQWIQVFKLHDATGQTYFMPRPCMQCEDAPCLRVCPTGATFADADGIVLVDQTHCIGCRTCMAACPYEARYFNWYEPLVKPPLATTPTPEFPTPQIRGTVGKCVFCVKDTARGMLPFCVSGCPMNAIWIGDLNTDAATNGQESVRLSSFLTDNDAVRFKEELNTRPRVWYIPGHGQGLEF